MHALVRLDSHGEGLRLLEDTTLFPSRPTMPSDHVEEQGRRLVVQVAPPLSTIRHPLSNRCSERYVMEA
ncbi:hypothetical protein [Streptosporangium roseum]|uniref:Uncharacterized protein n=1 Tax=Streptosporangium roseum (strain ATCC 12428 / DSM 43021 / JCM 3005 / KCTC 9067 / NCIMB 10171 / NRRL 2505 / NI 9100) TaxID=479432 RepID=D2AVY5_STRRD|nr:hypothetical protein [Streptosporangium roseum]ACZ83104.1 hypothetical protein Sros_0044 [Streptosporangium roseum DSM 43021]